MVLRFVDLFCGLGAFHLGLLQAGVRDSECVFACDIDKTVADTYALNFGVQPKCCDVREVKEEEIPEFDLLCAGSPCQSHSIAGKKTGLEDEDRGQLIFHVFRIARYHKPKYIIIENVKNLLSVCGGTAFKTIYDALIEIGYRVHYDVLNAARYGCAQARERLYIVCVRNNLPDEFRFPEPNNDHTRCRVRNILDPDANMVDDNAIQNKYDVEEIESVQQFKPFKPKVIAHLVNKDSGKKGRQGERVYDIDHAGATICASSGGPGAKTGLYRVNGVMRTLTVKEVLRMFGFPEDYKYECSDKHMIGYLGNSIVVPVVARIFENMVLSS